MESDNLHRQLDTERQRLSDVEQRKQEANSQIVKLRDEAVVKQQSLDEIIRDIKERARKRDELQQ